MIRSVVAASEMSPSTVSTAESPPGLIVRDVATTAQPRRRYSATGQAPMPWEPPVTIATLWFCSLMTVPSSAAGERGVTGVWGERRRLHAHPGVQRQRREIAFIPAESGACHRPSARPWPGSAQSRSRDPCPASSRARSASRWVVASTVSGAVSAGTATVNVVRNSLPPGSGAGVHGFSVCRAGSFG